MIILNVGEYQISEGEEPAAQYSKSLCSALVK